jgi:hypothetical protein
MIWLSTSLFCNKCYWHTLLSLGLLPIVENFGDMVAYEITFNYLSGENIRLGMLTEDKNAYTLSKAANDYFKVFFKNAELAMGESKLPVKGIFMPFPVNSIQYGLYLPLQQAEQYSSLSIGLSQIIINALKDDTIDDNTILTFAFYLQVGLIKVIGKGRINFTDMLNTTGNYDISIRNINQKEFTENRDVLIEITTDILHNNTDSPQWLKKWMMLCDKEINKAQNINPLNCYNKLVSLIYKQLGLDNNMRLMLTEFISGCFADMRGKPQKK